MRGFGLHPSPPAPLPGVPGRGESVQPLQHAQQRRVAALEADAHPRQARPHPRGRGQRHGVGNAGDHFAPGRGGPGAGGPLPPPARTRSRRRDPPAGAGSRAADPRRPPPPRRGRTPPAAAAADGARARRAARRGARRALARRVAVQHRRQPRPHVGPPRPAALAPAQRQEAVEHVGPAGDAGDRQTQRLLGQRPQAAIPADRPAARTGRGCGRRAAAAPAARAGPATRSCPSGRRRRRRQPGGPSPTSSMPPGEQPRLRAGWRPRTTAPSAPRPGGPPTAPATRGRRGVSEGRGDQRWDGAGPGGAAEVGEDRLPVVAPEVGRRPQRHQPAEVVGGADAPEVVVAAEARGVAQVDQPAQDAQLRARGVEVVQAGDVAARRPRNSVSVSRRTSRVPTNHCWMRSQNTAPTRLTVKRRATARARRLKPDTITVGTVPQAADGPARTSCPSSSPRTP